MDSLKFIAERVAQGRNNEALEIISGELRNNPTLADASRLNRMAAEIHLADSRHDQAFLYAEAARRFALRLGDAMLLTSSLQTLGTVYSYTNRYRAASDTLNHALTLANLEGNGREKNRILLNIAVLEQRQGNHLRALDILKNIVELNADPEGKKILALCQERMALSYTEIGETTQALGCTRLMAKIAHESRETGLAATSCLLEGILYLKLTDFSRALGPLEKSFRLFKKGNDNRNLITVLCNLARVRAGLRQDSETSRLVEQAKNLAKEMGSASAICELKRVEAEIAIIRRKGEKAVEHLREALRRAETADEAEMFSVIHETISKLVEKMGIEVSGLEEVLKSAIRDCSRYRLKNQTVELNNWYRKIKELQDHRKRLD